MITQPCVGCGYCCTTATCVLGIMKYGLSSYSCSGLQFDGRRFWCTLITGAKEEEERLRYSNDLAIGAGCSSSLFNIQREACKAGKLEEYLQARRSSSLSSAPYSEGSPQTKSSSPLEPQRKK